jgi:hypothetical protein
MGGLAWADEGPAAAVTAHFAAIEAQDYTAADKWFSVAFLKAFKPDVAKLNEYYLARTAQLARGYQIIETAAMNDPGHETAIVTVDFGDVITSEPLVVTERMYYYLVKEKALGGPGADAQGMSWRIDIFDALRFETLADARRRAYLNTGEAWVDQNTREMRSRQGLFRIQWALEQYYDKHGEYPARLLGGNNKRDALITGGQLKGEYPRNGFTDKAMKSVKVRDISNGDFSYVSIDSSRDGRPDGYWLLMHLKNPASYYYRGLDVVYILSSKAPMSQADLAKSFANYWKGASRETLVETGNAESIEIQGGLVAPVLAPAAGMAQPEPGAAEPQPEAPDGESGEATAVQVSDAPEDQPVAPSAGARLGRPALTAFARQLAEQLTASAWLPFIRQVPVEPAPPPAPEPVVIPKATEELVVRSYGWH